MLAALSIRDIVLIDALDLELGSGLTALTGETGAGKSILLDAFALALGARGDARLVRGGCKSGQVTAVFELPAAHPAFVLLARNDIAADDDLVLRRVQSADGRTRAFINDVPVGAMLLRQLGQLLVEIHGQHDDRALTDLATHRELLDAYAGLGRDVASYAAHYQRLKEAEKQLAEHRAALEAIRARAGYLEHVLVELRGLDPREGEEEALAARRQQMMSAGKIVKDLQALDDALSSRGGLGDLSTALRRLERQPAGAEELIQPVTQAVERVLVEVGEAQSVLGDALDRCRYEPRELEEAEQRLFALREAARKHRVPVHELVPLQQKMEAELAELDAGEGKLNRLSRELEELRQVVLDMARALNKGRRASARRLDAAVNAELPPLKLEKARFITEITSDEDKLGPLGFDQVVFHVRTNPGSKPGPLMQVASGGELSRFILALKVVLAAMGAAPVLIFDEVDKGVGGATASAIGTRLARLADSVQVFAVTHAPQIAALSDAHMHISKETRSAAGDEQTLTSVRALDRDERREEIARMLAGNKVTDEARAAADRLMGNEA